MAKKSPSNSQDIIKISTDFVLLIREQDARAGWKKSPSNSQDIIKNSTDFVLLIREQDARDGRQKITIKFPEYN
ncbi:hypothetical protein [Okeania sp. SIO2B3]|uniref:hypothetical protein n=1 Tax=Okeania sp. SIO2B3 TaxID=2607784 RepID=UPI0013C0B706|nr:hypothetical protein [Okeania sp. SIO2B3]NET42517.1 hypothetical protein [Okeania sp. SIO2B3]